MAWQPIARVTRRVTAYRNGVRGLRAEEQPTNAILYAEDMNPVYGHLDVLTDAVNLAGETAVVGNESLGALGATPLARGSMLVRGETAYENMPPGNSLQVPHWNSNVSRGVEPVTLLPGPWERVTLSHQRYRHGDEWVYMLGGTTPTYPFAAGNPRPGLFWRWEGRDVVRVQGAVVDTFYSYDPARSSQAWQDVRHVAVLPPPAAPHRYVCTTGYSQVAGAVGSPPNSVYFGLVAMDGLVYTNFNNTGTAGQGVAVYLSFSYAAASQRD